jgi:hypothetical protein
MEEKPSASIPNLTEDGPVDEKARESLQNFIGKQSIPTKVELAAKGNREVRQILSRDPNKLVARAVIESPRLSESDVLDYVSSSLTNDEVLRAIGENREWMSKVRLVMLLVSNPRTPPPVSLRFLPRLSVADLNLLHRNRNIPVLVRREAKRLAVRGI